MLGIKYVIENKLQNNTDYNTNTRFTLENPVGKNQPSMQIQLGGNHGPLKPCTTRRKPWATKTMCLKPLTSLLIPNSRLTLTCKCSFLVREKNKSFL